MRPAVSIGTQDFEKIRKNQSFYIDKSLFLQEWWESGDDVTLITRPRRFGKTLNLSMVNCFFSNRYADGGELFAGLNIWEIERYHRLQGSYPVIYLSFADVKGKDFFAARMGIIQKLAKLYSNYAHIRESLSGIDAAFFDRVGLDMTDDAAAVAIQNLSDFLYRFYGKKVLILLDEYDTPMQEAYTNGYWDMLTPFVRSLLNSTFKTNPSMERGLLTGITRVSKASVFSDLNNLEVVTTTSSKYCRQFGFTEEEVFEALEQFGLANEKERVRQWYDGFIFGEQKGIYNPWSITCYLEQKKYKPYWAHSSSNELISRLIQQGNPQTKMMMEDLLEGKTLTMEIDEEIIFDQLQRKRGALWSLLLASGYLKVTANRFEPDSGRFVYDLQLTNREVRMMFEDMIRDWFSNEDTPYHAFLQAFLQGDVEYMNKYINQVAKQIFSFFDVGNRPSDETNPERFYHGFVLGLIVELAGKYRITSNRESGFGRYDVMLEPVDLSQTAYVLESKVRNPDRENALEDTLRSALMQIEKKGYDEALLARGIEKSQIRHYGFAFEGKQVLIG